MTDSSPLPADPAPLVALAVRGDRDAFWRLIGPYRGLIYSVALGMLKDHERAEDQLHEVLIKAFQSIGNLRDPRRLGSWLYSMTRNHIFDLMRREQRLRRALHGAAADLGRVVPVAEMQEKELWFQQMEQGIAQLPEPFRVILGLKYMNDYSYGEIAEILELSLSAVKSRLFEARKLLRHKTEALARDALKGNDHGS